MSEKPPHHFHIPVMGTGFTVDTPLKVARYGISSVISLVDDVLIEQMRKFHCEKSNEAYLEISDREEDHRARRITAYLNLLDLLVQRQVQALQESPFEPGSEITRYYELLPEGRRKSAYRAMLGTTDHHEKARYQKDLRSLATPGSIDVNIMTKLDRDAYLGTQKQPPEFSDALSALRGFANSTVHGSVVFSAGLNPRLYSYTAQFPDFLPDQKGLLKKQIILKVSDFRSAAVQGRFLAKRGLWVSEFRVESGLNCGGHAFATQGFLLGPILEEFREKKWELFNDLSVICAAALSAQGKPMTTSFRPARVTVQGGIGTASEQDLLTTYYAVDGTGWGTPFLLVPEAVNVDKDHLQKLADAKERDVILSDHSPLGIPFWVLTNSASEAARERRVKQGQPGTTCPKGYLALNTEFTAVPICPASHAYQRLKLLQLDQSSMPEPERTGAKEAVMRKTCICHDLAGSATLKYGIDTEAATSVCCGPNIAYFNKVATLCEMIDHIYGRISLLASGYRPHMFIRELMLYVDHLKKECSKISSSTRTQEHLSEFKANLLTGIAHYHRLADQLAEQKACFLEELARLHSAIEIIQIPQSHIILR
jgi:hypothetical protein